MQLGSEGILFHVAIDANSRDKKILVEYESYLLPSFLEVVFSLLLVVSACYITSWLGKSTGKKQNTCLLTWHIINLFILTIVIALDAIFFHKANSSNEDDKDYWKHKYYNDTFDLI